MGSRAHGKLTDRQAKALKPMDGKEAYAWDGELRGFGLRCSPGGTKSFIFQYRFGRRTRKITFARYPNWSVERARREAGTYAKSVTSHGQDPAAELNRQRKALTVAAVVEQYIEEIRDKGRTRRGPAKPSTVKRYHSLLDRFIRPTIGTLAITDVTRRDVERMHREVAGKDERKFQANRVLQVVRSSFRFALERDYVDANPTEGVRLFPENQRERVLTSDEIHRLLAALDDLETRDDIGAHLFRFLLFTGWRRTEALSLRWDDVQDVERITLRDTKTARVETRELSEPAADVLRSIRRLYPFSKEWVFPGGKKGAGTEHRKNVTAWRDVREAAGLPDLRLHDLRHSFVSWQLKSGAQAHAVAKLVGHKRVETTLGRYGHHAPDWLRETATKGIEAMLRGNRE